MKYLLLLAVIFAVLWFARRGRLQGRAAARPAPQQEDMVACAQCGVHLPRSEALPGRGGLFCTEAHRTDFERSRA